MENRVFPQDGWDLSGPRALFFKLLRTEINSDCYAELACWNIQRTTNWNFWKGYIFGGCCWFPKKIFKMGEPVFESFFSATSFDCSWRFGSFSRKFVYGFPSSRVLLVYVEIRYIFYFPVYKSYLCIKACFVEGFFGSC